MGFEGAGWGRGALAGVALLGVLGVLHALRPSAPAVPPAPRVEPDTLGFQPLPDAFGLGEGVDFETPDLKAFRFELTAVPRAAAVLHFQAQGIGPGELVVSVNGHEVGEVPADTPEGARRPLRLLVPAGVLRAGGKNRVVFDSTRNPPHAEPWRVWNTRVEVLPLPELPPGELVSEARGALRRSLRAHEAAEVGARNRYDAWRAAREAWLLLEAHPAPRPALHREARERLAEVQGELDRLCTRLLLEAERLHHQRRMPEASAALDAVHAHFPGRDQPCPALAEARRAALLVAPARPP